MLLSCHPASRMLGTRRQCRVPAWSALRPHQNPASWEGIITRIQPDWGRLRQSHACMSSTHIPLYPLTHTHIIPSTTLLH